MFKSFFPCLGWLKWANDHLVCVWCLLCCNYVRAVRKTEKFHHWRLVLLCLIIPTHLYWQRELERFTQQSTMISYVFWLFTVITLIDQLPHGIPLCKKLLCRLNTLLEVLVKHTFYKHKSNSVKSFLQLIGTTRIFNDFKKYHNYVIYMLNCTTYFYIRSSVTRSINCGAIMLTLLIR